MITGFSVTPDIVFASTPTTVTWTYSVDDPDASCAIDGVGPIESGGTSSVSLAASTTYTLRCKNDGGEGTAFVALTVTQDPIAPVVASLSAAPTQLLANVATDVAFTWTYTGTPAPTPTCTIDRGIGEVINGIPKSVTLPSTSLLTMTCTNSEGSDTATITLTTVTAPVAPNIATFTSTPASVIAGTATTVAFNWTFTGTPTPAAACSIDNGIGAITSGTQKSITIAANTTYTLTCTNSAGTDTQPLTITTTAQVAPIIATVTATPDAVDNGVQTPVVWTWTYANTPVPTPTCSLDNALGAITQGGTTDITIMSDTTYTLTCTNTAGSDTETETITVNL